MSREIIRVEPLSSYLERYKAPASVMTRHGNTLYVSGLPPFDPATGEIVKAPIERQTELVIEQLKLCMKTAGSFPRQHFDVHRLLHIGADVLRRQRRLCEILSEESARTHVRECPRASRAVRYRDRLRRLGLGPRKV